MSKKQDEVLVLGARDLVVEDLAAVLGDTPPRLELSPESRERCAASRAVVERVLAEGKTVYGVNTGFGKLADRRIEDDKLQLLQRNLILSHATGVGRALPKEISRLMLVLRLQALSRGISGVRQELLDRLLELYNLDLLPVIPEQGSVGASGDLAPLAHMAIVLLGDGEVWRGEERIHAGEALAAKGIEPFELSAKEGLALINGTQCMTAIGVQTLLLAERLVKTADVACALSLEALKGSTAPFQPGVHEARGQEGQIRTAQNLLRLLAESQVVESHVDCDRVQDPYSLRCVPQVHGAVRDAIAYVRRILSFEINAATDNPLIFPNGDVISAGNFHGQSVSQAMDFLGIALSTLANISERRIENMVNPALSRMPAFLAPNPGLESGFMIPQVVAASLASENKVLAHPSSVDTIPTSANQEDHVSMGVTAARHARDIANNTAKVIGIELLCGAQGLSFARDHKAGKGVELAYARIRQDIPPLTQDRFLAPDLLSAEILVTSGAILAAVEPTVPLQA